MNGASTGHGLDVLLSDHQGTVNTVIALPAGRQITRRTCEPYGDLRGAKPSAWPDNRTYLGVGIDEASGLTHLGAREYDQAAGRFVPADPVMDHADPLQMNGFAYSHNSPISRSDPTGLWDALNAPDKTGKIQTVVDGYATMKSAVQKARNAVLKAAALSPLPAHRHDIRARPLQTAGEEGRGEQPEGLRQGVRRRRHRGERPLLPCGRLPLRLGRASQSAVDSLLDPLGIQRSLRALRRRMPRSHRGLTERAIRNDRGPLPRAAARQGSRDQARP